MTLDTHQMLLVEQRVTNEGPSVGVAYLLWFFFGALGVHRFYLSRVGSGVAMLLLTITFFGLFISIPWWLVDAFLIPDMARQRRDELRRNFALALAGHPPGYSGVAPTSPGYAPPNAPATRPSPPQAPPDTPPLVS